MTVTYPLEPDRHEMERIAGQVLRRAIGFVDGLPQRLPANRSWERSAAADADDRSVARPRRRTLSRPTEEQP